MLTAIYFPHTDIRNEVILKNAMLLWDGIQTIVPQTAWKHHRFENRASNEAVDLVVSGRKPNREEQQHAHEALRSLLEAGELSRIITAETPGSHRNPYLIYP